MCDLVDYLAMLGLVDVSVLVCLKEQVLRLPEGAQGDANMTCESLRSLKT